MWDLYLGLCEATFLERRAGLFPLMLLRNGARRVLVNQPWIESLPRHAAADATESAA